MAVAVKLCGCACVHVFEQALWRNRIVRYFQNARCRRDSDLKIVVSHRKKQTQLQSKTFEQSVTLFGIKNYLPQRLPGDSDDTIADMIKMTIDEDRRLKPNVNRIDELIDRTLPDRRKFIVTDGATTTELKARFPCLFSQDQVH